MRMRFFPALLVVLLLLCLASLAGAEQLIIPENTRIIEDDAFSGSAQISDVILPADLKHIGDRAFWGCGITRIEVPDSVTEIGENAFPAGTVIASASDAYAREWAQENGYSWVSADPHCYALLIGQGYPDFPERKRLTAPAYDVGGMAAMLSIMSATPYQVTVKYDLTADGILSAIRNTFAEARPGDICLFYYSGHGEYKASDPSLTGALVGVDANFVTLSALRNALNGVNGDKIVVLDSCYSGVMVVNRGEAADERDDALLDEVNRAVIRTFAMASRGDADGKYYVMTSARYDELAYDYAGQSDPHRYGIFTAFLLEGSGYSERTDAFLGNLAADTDGNRMITLRQGFTFASAEATDFYISLGKTDHPHAQVYPENSSFVLWGQGK